MIKTPVSYDENELIYYPQIHDADGDYLFEAMDTDTAKEIVKRINMHDEIVKSLTEMCEMWLFVCECNGYDENHMNQYKSAKELLERCK